jgi:vacuolar-type H+-ATPase subunit I/STV1
MNAWLALPLTLLLGQTPATDEAPTREPSEEEVRAAQELELQQLRAEVATLRAQVLTQQEENQNRLQSLEQQQATQQARATELEQLRLERVASLARAYEWLISADQQLEIGERSIGPALISARQELTNALATADEAGRGQTARLIQSALARLSTVDDDVAQRNLYVARRQLEAAGLELHEAWRLSINRQGTTLVNP